MNPIKAASAPGSCPHQAERNADLTARGTGKELAEPDDAGIGRLIEPLAAFHKLFAEISQMRNRTAKTRAAQPEEHQQNLERAVHPIQLNGLKRSATAYWSWIATISPMLQ